AGIRDRNVTGVQTCALPIFAAGVGGGRRDDRGRHLPVRFIFGADIADFTESGGAQQRRLRVADEVRLSLFGRARPLVVPAHRHKDRKSVVEGERCGLWGWWW